MDGVYIILAWLDGAVLAVLVSGLLARYRPDFIGDTDDGALLFICAIWPIVLAVIVLALPLMLVVHVYSLYMGWCRSGRKGDVDGHI